MAKQKFTIAHDIRFDGKHVARGSQIELDATSAHDAAVLNNLLSSNRVVEIEAAHKHLDEASKAEKKAPALPAVSQPPSEKAPEKK